MSTFGADSQTTTELETGLPAADYSLTRNYQGSAPMNNTITQDTWLPGTTGIDCKLVQGNRWQEIAGDMNESYGGSVVSNIAKNDDLTINGSRTVTVIGNVTESYTGAYSLEVWQSVNIHYHSTATSIVDGVANLAQSSPSFTWNGPAIYQNFGFQWTFVGSQVQVFVTALSLYSAIQIQANALNVTASAIGVDLQYIAIQKHGYDLTLSEAVQKIVLAYGKVKAVLVRAGGAALQAISKLNAMISAGVGTPFR